MSLNPFLEERISVAIKLGASYSDSYNVRIVDTAADAEHRALVHPFPKRHFRIGYVGSNDALYANLCNIYHRVFGTFGGFRAKCLDDYSTNGQTAAPTSFDQTLTAVSAGVYQLQKTYGLDAPGLSIGRPSRLIYKPVAGTVLVAVGAVAMAGTLWAVDNTTGRVTFTDKSKAITAISQAAQAVLTIGAHTLLAGESVQVSGVVGMTQINGLRGTITAITATTITLNINSTAFTAYTSGGAVHSNPQSGEVVTGGCEFDIPVRFATALDILAKEKTVRDVGTIELIELINP